MPISEIPLSTQVHPATHLAGAAFPRAAIPFSHGCYGGDSEFAANGCTDAKLNEANHADIDDFAICMDYRGGFDQPTG